MSQRSLEDLLRSSGNPVELLRNSQAGPNVYPGVPSEYTNWRDEQLAWQETCVLFNQSYHMADLAVEGPDALALLSSLAVNSFDGFTVDKAKHFVPCTPDGYVIGDVILFGKWSGTEVKIDGEELLIMKESDIMGIVEGRKGSSKKAA